MKFNNSNFLSENTDKVSFKKHLRTELKRRRALLSVQLEADLVLQVSRFLGALSGAKVVGIYSAFGSEPEIEAAAEKWADESGGSLALPFVLSVSERKMEYRISYNSHSGRLPSIADGVGIRSSSGHVVVPDLILIPCLGFSSAGRRLGYGGGFYDKYLSTHVAASVGVAYNDLEIEENIFEEHDVELDEIITELGVLGLKVSREAKKCAPEGALVED